MLDRLAAARVSQRAFIADAAHELRSPLASLRMQLDVAQHVGEGGSLPADLIPELDRLSTLVDDLLTLARLGDSAPPAPTPVPIAPLLDGLRHRYAVARVPVHVTVPEGDLTAYGISGDVLRAVTNLCLLYTSDAADERSSVDLGGRRIIKKKKHKQRTDHVIQEMRRQQDTNNARRKGLAVTT